MARLCGNSRIPRSSARRLRIPANTPLKRKRLTNTPVSKIVSVLKWESVRRNLSNFQIVVTAVSMSS